MTIILLLVSLLLDIIVPNLIINFIPLFTIGTIVIISSFNISDEKLYITLLIYGILYDLINTDLLFVNTIIFIIIAYVLRMLNTSRKLFSYVLSVIIYLLLMTMLTLVITFHMPYNLTSKLTNTIIINSIYFLIIYLFYIVINKVISNKSKKTSYL